MSIIKQKIIKNSLIGSIEEEFLILLKELNFINNILLFFNKSQNGNNLSERKDELKKMLHEIAKLTNRSNSIKNHIEELKKLNSEEFAIFYDYVRIETEEMLQIVSILYNKVNQYFGEMMNQYLPYPTFFGRRYSNYNLLVVLDKYYHQMYKYFIAKQNAELVFLWNHTTDYRYRPIRNPNIQRFNYSYSTHNDYIELAYWYFELPYLIPATTHEVIKIILRDLRYEDNFNDFTNTNARKLFEIYKDFENYIQEFFSQKRNLLVANIDESIGYSKIQREIIKNIFADIVAYLIYGKAYFYTLLHINFAKGLAKHYLTVYYKRNETKNNNNTDIIDKAHIQIEKWIFDLNKDLTILRLAVLYFLFYDKILIQENKQDKHNELKELLNTFISFDSNEYKLNNEAYKSVSIFLKQIFYLIKNWLNETKNKSTNREVLTKVIDEFCDKNPINCKIAKVYQDLWNDRFNNLKNEQNQFKFTNFYRKKLHEILTLNDKSNDIFSNNKLYILTLRKVRKNSLSKISKITEYESKNNTTNLLKFNTLGIWDAAFLEEKDLFYYIDKKTNFLIKNLESSSNRELKYFDSKFMLMLAKSNIDIKETKNYNMAFFINIELERDYNTYNGYKNLKKSIEDIAKAINNKKYQIYKSLGPKDLYIVIYHNCLEEIYDCLNNIKNKNQLKRTFSFIGIREIKDFECTKNINFSSFIRLRSKKNISNIISNDLKNSEIFRIVGNFDYKIKWKNDISLKSIFSFYEKNIDNLSDYQTILEKEEKIF